MYANIFKKLVNKFSETRDEDIVSSLVIEFDTYIDHIRGNEEIYFIDGSRYTKSTNKAESNFLIIVDNGVYIPKIYCYTKSGVKRVHPANLNIKAPELIFDTETEKWKLTFNSSNRRFEYYFDGIDKLIQWLNKNGKKKQLSETVKRI